MDATRSRSIEAHVRVCGKCRSQVDSARGLSALLGATPMVDVAPRVQAGLARRLALSEDTPRFTCARALHWMSESLDGELGAEESRLLHAHVAHCPACASESAALEAVAAVMRAVPEVVPPIGLERCIRAAVAREQRGWLPRWLSDGLFRPRLNPGFATAFAAATLIAGFYLGKTSSSGPAVAVQKPTPTYTGHAQPDSAVASQGLPGHRALDAAAQRAERRRHEQERFLAATLRTMKALNPVRIVPPAAAETRTIARVHHPAPVPSGFVPAPVIPPVVAINPVTNPTPEAPRNPAPPTVAEQPAPVHDTVAMAPRPTRVAPRSQEPIPPIEMAQAARPTGHETWKTRGTGTSDASFDDLLKHEQARLQGNRPQDKAVYVPVIRASFR